MQNYNLAATSNRCTSVNAYTNTTTEIVNLSLRILEAIFHKGIYYKRAGIMVSGISSADALQPDLFTFNPEQRKRYQDISRGVDVINCRNGADTVVLGSQQYREKGEDGKSIKFVNAIRRAMKSPDYSTRLGAFVVS